MTLHLRQAGGGPFFEGVAGDVPVCLGGKAWGVGPVPLGALLADGTNANAWAIIQGDPAELIASVSITVRENSRLLIQAMTGIQNTVAAGRFFVTCPDLPGSVGSQSADPVSGIFQTLNLYGLSAPLVAGPHPVELFINVNGAVGAKADSASANVLVVQEIPAT